MSWVIASCRACRIATEQDLCIDRAGGYPFDRGNIAMFLLCANRIVFTPYHDLRLDMNGSVVDPVIGANNQKLIWQVSNQEALARRLSAYLDRGINRLRERTTGAVVNLVMVTLGAVRVFHPVLRINWSPALPTNVISVGRRVSLIRRND